MNTLSDLAFRLSKVHAAVKNSPHDKKPVKRVSPSIFLFIFSHASAKRI